jgi:hypothetical protein
MPTLVKISTWSRREPAAEDGLGFAARVAGYPPGVHVGGVDGVEAGVHEDVEQREAARLVDGPAEHVAAEDERGDLQAGVAERAILHGASLGARAEDRPTIARTAAGRPARPQ